MNTVFGVPVINILWTIVAGRRFQLDDPRVERMMNLLNRFDSARRREERDVLTVAQHSDIKNNVAAWKITHFYM